MDRRESLTGTATTALVLRASDVGARSYQQGATMYGLIGKMTAVGGQRDTLAAVLLEGTQAMPGCQNGWRDQWPPSGHSPYP
jgi:hypothetical protein